MLNIIYSEKFVAQFERIPSKKQEIAIKKIDVFRNNPKHPSLKAHKLHGVLKEFFSFSVDHETRIIFEYGGKNTVHFLKIGDHEVYR
jgi:mRNA-degrading endonuclease YafQ of YafQ-DinJ toxin-antitoxin module